MNNLLYEELTYKIIGAGQEVYKELGPVYLKKQQTYIVVEILSKKYAKEQSISVPGPTKELTRKKGLALILIGRKYPGMKPST